MKKAIVVVAIVVAVAVIVVVGGVAVHRPQAEPSAPSEGGPKRDTVGEMMNMLSESPEQVAARLEPGGDETILTGALALLREMGSPAGREKAAALLESERNLVWLNAALYLGELGDERAIPYLIKSMDRPRLGTQREAARLLTRLTGQDLGVSQEAWIEWWRAEHPDSEVDFTPTRPGTGWH